MTRYDLAFAIMEYLPTDALEQIAEIGKTRADRKMVLNFKDGRCRKAEVTDIRQYGNEHFTEGAQDEDRNQQK